MSTIAEACLDRVSGMGNDDRRPGLRGGTGQTGGEMRWALYVTLAPAWLDPGEAVPGVLTPFWVLYALHDALVKPMPGQLMAPSLAESWSMSEDQLVYEFTLRKGLKFHNGDPFTAEDVEFSFKRAKGAQLHEKVKEVVVVDPTHVRFVLHEPWPDFMTYYGTLASAASWIVPKGYIEKVGADGFKAHPIGLGPYKFVSMKPGLELVMEAFEGYWRKVPSIKRIVFQSVPEATTRLAMLTRGDVDVAYLLDESLAESVKNDPKLKLAFSGGIGTYYLDFLDMWDPKSPWPTSACARLQASRSTGTHSAKPRRSAPPSPTATSCFDASNTLCRSMPTRTIRRRRKSCSRRRAIRTASTPAICIPGRPISAPARRSPAISARSASRRGSGRWSAPRSTPRSPTKKLKGLCMCIAAGYGNASSRLAEIVPSSGSFAYGGYPDIDELYQRQLGETDPAKREAMLHQIQKTLHERTRFAPIYDYFWASGIGPRVEDPALMQIDPFPWSAPLEEVRLKRQ